MNLTDFDFTLRWPLELFVWEGRRIDTIKSNASFWNMVVCLFSEAFVDGDIAESLGAPIARSVWEQSTDPRQEASRVLNVLLKDPSILHKYGPPEYWLERQGRVESIGVHKSLAKVFVELIDEMRDLDYFPKVLAKGCVDDGISWGEYTANASAEISKAVHADVIWPLEERSAAIPEEILYSVIEYLHDQAQRPRTRSLHDYGQCGWHYGDHNKESGGAVYRWRVNELLDRYGVGLRLGKTGSEKGRLIRHASLELDGLSEQLSATPADTDEEKVASAIRQYRARASTVHDRRGSIAQLAGYLEKRRQTLKLDRFASGDEADLFNVFNNFAIRHDNHRQKQEYGEEYLDWIFWQTLAAIQLLQKIEKRVA